MKIISVTSKKFGCHKIFVDNQDFDRVSKFIWSIVKRGKTIYAFRNTKSDNTIIYMHRFILGLKKSQKTHVDHKDGNGLNNQRSNLRRSTKAQNLMNRGANKNNTTGFKGVSFHRGNKKYRAVIMVKRKWIFGGNFNDPISAAKRYNELAAQHFGEFAKLNPIPNA